jgi:MFS family permease
MDRQAANPQASPRLEAEYLTPYLCHLTFFICVCSFFEAYNTLAISLALPYIGKEFHADAAALGFAVGIINFGTIVAFIPVRLADRYGRRLILLVVVTAFTVFTMATAMAAGIVSFVVLQFFARMFLVSEVGVGPIMLAEELPARYRGRAIMLALSLAALAAIFGPLIFPWLITTRPGWRLLYLPAGAMIPVLAFYWQRIRETRRWSEQSHDRAKIPLVSEFRATFDVFQRRYWRELVAGTSVWFLTNFWTSGLLFFFAYYALSERGWTPVMLRNTMTFAIIVSFMFYLSTGPLLDFAGRRVTAFLCFALGSLSLIVCFHAKSHGMIVAAYTVGSAMNAVWGISITITTEIFPTAMRASANAVVNNLLGRIGMVAAAGFIGVFSKVFGSVGDALILVGVISLIASPIVVLLPETKQQVLEDIEHGEGPALKASLQPLAMPPDPVEKDLA